ncbi:MAG: DNA alkylation repair protein [Anaerolineales bacterium]|nr:DNA alkylation repair protein [Anaerolineales bacterium]
MTAEIKEKTAAILQSYTASDPHPTADALQQYWLSFDPNLGIYLIKAEQREQIGAAGTPVPVLKAIGSQIAKTVGKDVDTFLPLARLLWDRYGREGRVISLIVFGTMELVDPKRLVPLLKELCRSCVSWEDADRLAMDALEPIVRKSPDPWLDEIVAWLDDENKWVRRAAITVIARLPMKHPGLTASCLQLTERLLCDTDTDVRRAVSFAIRLCAKADPGLVITFMEKQLSAPPANATWVLCDVIKSLDKKLIGDFSKLIPLYEKWSSSPSISSKDLRTIESALKTLKSA